MKSLFGGRECGKVTSLLLFKESAFRSSRFSPENVLILKTFHSRTGLFRALDDRDRLAILPEAANNGRKLFKFFLDLYL
jgi:hypothetical protein